MGFRCDWIGMCDRCGLEHQAFGAQSLEDLRVSAGRSGWAVVAGQDLCSACRTWMEYRLGVERRIGR